MRKMLSLLSVVCMFFAVSFGVGATSQQVTPVTAYASTTTAKSGAWGDLSWTLENRTLTISGNGPMQDFSHISLNKAWHAYKTQIQEVVIETGVTSIGAYAFYDYSELKNIRFADGIERIGEHAFYDCIGLTDIHLPEGLTTIENDVFSGCKNISVVYVSSTVTTIDDAAFWDCNVLYTVYNASPTVALGLTDGGAFNGLIYQARVILMDVAIPTLAPYLSLQYNSVENVVINGQSYVSYCLHNHVWETDGIKQPACGDTVLMGRVCREENCGLVTDYVAPHSFDQQVVSEEYLVSGATCETEAEYYYSCICGQQGTQTFTHCEPIGHQYGRWISNEDGTHTRTCSVNATHTQTLDCNGTATCTTRATCQDCGEKFGEPLGHDFQNYVSDNNATCLKNGTETASCERENCITKDTRDIADSKLTHTPSEPVIEDMVPPNCTTDGSYNAVVYCFACGTELSRSHKESEKIPHTPKPDWSCDDTMHWHGCQTCQDIRFEVALHKDENHDASCDVCGTAVSADSTSDSSSDSASNSSSDSVLNSISDSSSGADMDSGEMQKPHTDTPPKGLSGGAIAAIVVGSAAVAVLGGFSFFWFVIKKRSFQDLLEYFQSDDAE